MGISQNGGSGTPFIPQAVENPPQKKRVPLLPYKPQTLNPKPSETSNQHPDRRTVDSSPKFALSLGALASRTEHSHCRRCRVHLQCDYGIKRV